MARLVLGLAVAACLAAPPHAAANGFRWLFGSGHTSNYPPPAYYCAVPIIAIDPCVAPGPAGRPGFPTRTEPPLAISNFAKPKAAPPSSDEPPLGTPPLKRPPAVNETRSFFDAYARAPQPLVVSSGDHASIGFWNLSTRDVTLKIQDQTHALARGQNIQLKLPRQFVWTIDRRELLTERVPETMAGLEIVIRR